MAVLIGGSLLVAALIGWAVTRSMQAPTPTPAIGEPAPSVSETVTPAMTPPAQTTQSAALPDQAPDRAAVPRAEVTQLKQQVASGGVTIIDVRDMDSFAKEHIPGAVNIPFARLESEIPYIPKDKPIVTYCT